MGDFGFKFGLARTNSVPYTGQALAVLSRCPILWPENTVHLASDLTAPIAVSVGLLKNAKI